MDKWKSYKVRELVELGILERPMDGNHGEIHPKSSDFTETGVPFIMATDIKNGKIDLLGCKFIAKEQSKRLRKGFSYSMDVLLTHKASIGRTAIVPQLDSEYIMLTPQVTFYRVKDTTKLSYKYLKYYFDSNGFQEVLNSYGNSGSTRSYIGITEQLNLPILMPPIDNQLYIASILSSLDDKIELNIQMNKTLEAIAQAIFREWFVNFQFLGFDGDFVDGMPRGWKRGSLGEEFLLTMGQSPPGESLNENGEGTVFYQGRTDFAYRFPVKRVYTTSPNRMAKVNDTLISVRAPVGDINMAQEECCIGRGLSSVRHNSQAYSYTYYAMKNLEKIFRGFDGEGTIFGSINKTNFENIKIVVPDENVISRFEILINPIDEKIFINSCEIKTLTQIRDSLLPKLMSGKIRVQ